MRQAQTFAAQPGSVRAARRFAAEALCGLPSALLEPITLMVSELATNSVQHARTTFEVTIARLHREVRIEVTDDAGGTPEMRSPDPLEPTGRGLQIVDLLSDAWGVEPKDDEGKTVWLTVSTRREHAGQA